MALNGNVLVLVFFAKEQAVKKEAECIFSIAVVIAEMFVYNQVADPNFNNHSVCIGRTIGGQQM